MVLYFKLKKYVILTFCYSLSINLDLYYSHIYSIFFIYYPAKNTTKLYQYIKIYITVTVAIYYYIEYTVET